MSKKNISFFLLINGIILSFLILGLSLVSMAEIKTDSSLGAIKLVEATNTVYAIDASLGVQKDANLFHSFETFNIESGMTALFTGPSNIQAIISRVTGGNPSYIDGTIQSTIHGADVFLINPQGIIFGESAHLNIDGSFYASTADYLQMGETERFLSGSPDTSGLVTSSPQSFGFLDANIAPIEIHGAGKLPTDELNSDTALNNGFGVSGNNHLCIIGGKITIDQGAILTINDAPETQTTPDIEQSSKGSIQLISIKSASDIPFHDHILDYSQIKIFDDILVGNAAKLDVSGQTTGSMRLVGQNIMFDHSICSIENLGNVNGKTIEIIGENISLINEAKISSTTLSNADAASMNLSARADVTLTGLFTTIVSTSDENNDLLKGRTANISIVAQNIYINDGAEIKNRTFGLGDCRNITLDAQETIALSSKNKQFDASRIFLDSYRQDAESGNSGNMLLKAKNIDLSEGATLSASTRGSGQGGNITLDARENVHFYGYWTSSTTQSPQSGCRIYVRTYGRLDKAGHSGSVSIKAKNITMEDGASIKAETSSTGKGGDVTMIAEETILVQGENLQPVPSVIDLSCVSYRNNNGSGKAGDLHMTAKNISIKDGAWINTRTESLGDAGNIWIKASQKLEVSGEGGPYKQSMDMRKDTLTSAIVSSTTKESQGNGGNIDIQAGNLLLSGGTYIQTGTKSIGHAGTITIHDTDTITLMGISSDKSSSYIESNTHAEADFKEETTGNGGTIAINANHMNLFDGARISTSAIALQKLTGNAGDIDIKLTGTLQMSGQNLLTSDFLGQGSGIYARSKQENQAQAGAAGKINITADSIFMNDNSLISTSTNGIKNAGNIDIQTLRSIHITHSNIVSESMMSVINEQNGGAAGTITIQAERDIQLFQFARISTDAVSSGGGKINLNGGNALTLLNSKITTNVNQGEGNGGDINIRNEFTIMNHGIISANADGGDGGAIFIYTRNLIQSTDSQIEATSKRGNDGTVEIQTPDMDMSENLLNLSGNFLNTVNVVKTLCENINGRDAIHLVINKPYALPDSSNAWYNFSTSEPLRLLTKAHLDELDSFDHLSDAFSENVLYQLNR
ncbi:MAG: filamentous hemagglutinin N-terminal domain-containing protein [Candidatus Magnetomorum sp.]|nr:filamentous hemagglutinin N-terminal domain-containing protein [Candidatus Magnetomorum sp.]